MVSRVPSPAAPAWRILGKPKTRDCPSDGDERTADHTETQPQISHFEFLSRNFWEAAIVYQTDAATDTNVKIIGTFPADRHLTIIYPAALTAGVNHPDANAFPDYIKSAKATPLFEAQGFAVRGSAKS